MTQHGTVKYWLERVNRRLRIFAYRAYRRYQIDKAELLRRLESAK